VSQVDHLNIHRAELPEIEHHELGDPFSRGMAAATALTAFFAAVVGLALADAARHGDAATLATQQFAVASLGEHLRARQFAQAQYELVLLAEEDSLRAGAAFERGLLSSPAQRRSASLEQRRWEDVALKVRALIPSGSTIRNRDGPDTDPGFPRYFFARADWHSIELGAERDQADEESAGWERSKATYFAVLAITAVVLYLFGHSLAIRGRLRFSLAAVGTVLLAIAVGWGGSTWLHRPPHHSSQPARRFADGMVALRTGDLRSAVLDFRQVIGLDPASFRAHAEVASVLFQVGARRAVGLAGQMDTRELGVVRQNLMDSYRLLTGADGPTP